MVLEKRGMEWGKVAEGDSGKIRYKSCIDDLYQRLKESVEICTRHYGGLEKLLT